MKKAGLTIRDLRRLLFRCASSIISLEKVSGHLFFPLHRSYSWVVVRTRASLLHRGASIRSVQPCRNIRRDRGMVMGHIGEAGVRDRTDVQGHIVLDRVHQDGTWLILPYHEVSTTPLCRCFKLTCLVSSYSDPFVHEIEYSPSQRETVDRAAKTAHRLLLPHTLVLQLLVSRLQAGRYRKRGLMLLLQRLILASTNARVHMR